MSSLADKLWQASMGVTAFAVVQGLAFLLIAPEPSIQEALHRGKSYVQVIICVYHGFFLLAIHWCHHEFRADSSHSDPDRAARLSWTVEAGQLIMVMSFAIFAFLTVRAIDLDGA